MKNIINYEKNSGKFWPDDNKDLWYHNKSSPNTFDISPGEHNFPSGTYHLNEESSHDPDSEIEGVKLCDNHKCCISSHIVIELAMDGHAYSKEIIKSLRKHVSEIVNSEVSQSGTTIDLDLLSKRISSKILHVPMNRIKGESSIKENLYLKVLSDIFDLNNKPADNVLKLNNEKKHKNRN